jgi:hypothetical protein
MTATLDTPPLVLSVVLSIEMHKMQNPDDLVFGWRQGAQSLDTFKQFKSARTVIAYLRS